MITFILFLRLMPSIMIWIVSSIISGFNIPSTILSYGKALAYESSQLIRKGVIRPMIQSPPESKKPTLGSEKLL
jgi:hypothetical protein